MSTQGTPLSPKLRTGMAEQGRIYRGKGLGVLTEWQCPACGAPNTQKFELGCATCHAGAPGHQAAATPTAMHAPRQEPPMDTPKRSPLLAARMPAPPAQLLDQLRLVVREELARHTPEAQCTAAERYAITTALQLLIQIQADTGVTDPLLPAPDALLALAQRFDDAAAAVYTQARPDLERPVALQAPRSAADLLPSLYPETPALASEEE